MIWLLKAVGIVQIGLAFLHLAFPRRFNWREEAARLSRLNEQMFYVHTFFVCLILFLFGLLTLLLSGELLRGDLLSRFVNGGIGFFWFCRLLTQIFVYDSQLWRGKRLETVIHVCFLALWSVLTAVYAFVALSPGGEVK